MTPRTCAGLAALLLATHAQAAYVCTDAQGREFRVAQPFGGQVGLLCRRTQAGDDARMPSGSPVEAPDSAAEAFGFAAVPAPGVVPSTPLRPVAAERRPQPAAAGLNLLEPVLAGRVDGPVHSAGLALAPANVGVHVSAPTLEVPAALDTMIDEVAHEFGHDPGLLRAIVRVESRFNARAVSSKGAIGLMQVLPVTAASLGLEQPRQALFDPRANLRTGARYLRKLVDMFFGRIDLAIAAYNAGEGAVLRYHLEVPPFQETQDYVRDVMRLYGDEMANADTSSGHAGNSSVKQSPPPGS